MKSIISITVICIVLFGMIITACNRPNKPALSNEPNNARGSIEEEINWQALATDYNPSNIGGLLNAIKNTNIKADGNVVITPEIKREFNLRGEDYRFFFMPKVTWYDFKSTAYEPTGEALAYILFTWTGKFGTFPEKVPKYEAEARQRKIFAAPNNEYPQIKHQAYRKCVMFDGESYTSWPESYNANTMVYDLIKLNVRHDGDYTFYTASANEYQFDLTNEGYRPGENEIFLFDKAKALGLDYPKTLAKLLETGEIIKVVKSRTYTIEFRIQGDSTVPKIVSVDKD
jgi:hypothetical protein